MQDILNVIYECELTEFLNFLHTEGYGKQIAIFPFYKTRLPDVSLQKVRFSLYICDFSLLYDVEAWQSFVSRVGISSDCVGLLNYLIQEKKFDLSHFVVAKPRERQDIPKNIADLQKIVANASLYCVSPFSTLFRRSVYKR